MMTHKKKTKVRQMDDDAFGNDFEYKKRKKIISRCYRRLILPPLKNPLKVNCLYRQAALIIHGP